MRQRGAEQNWRNRLGGAAASSAKVADCCGCVGKHTHDNWPPSELLLRLHFSRWACFRRRVEPAGIGQLALVSSSEWANKLSRAGTERRANLKLGTSSEDRRGRRRRLLLLCAARRVARASSSRRPADVSCRLDDTPHFRPRDSVGGGGGGATANRPADNLIRVAGRRRQTLMIARRPAGRSCSSHRRRGQCQCRRRRRRHCRRVIDDYYWPLARRAALHPAERERPKSPDGGTKSNSS